MHSPGLQTKATSSSDYVKSRDLDPCSRKEAPLSIFSWQVFVFILLTSGSPVAKRNFGIQQPSAISEIYFFIKALGHQTSDLRTNQYCLLHILKLPSDTIEKIRFSEIRSPAN